ncbi:hypothetical protein KKF19_02995 [Patescibacteria group bacterium]|nr:hypothetical protein [Patescibacteria group bacterium]
MNNQTPNSRKQKPPFYKSWWMKSFVYPVLLTSIVGSYLIYESINSRNEQFIDGNENIQVEKSQSMQGDGNIQAEGDSAIIQNSEVTININRAELPEGLLNQDWKLDKTEREFFETIKSIFNCRLDNGIVCAMNFLPVYDQTGERTLKNTKVVLIIKEKNYELFLSKLDGEPRIVGQCNCDFSECFISPYYLLKNNQDKQIENCIVIKYN